MVVDMGIGSNMDFNHCSGNNLYYHCNYSSAIELRKNMPDSKSSETDALVSAITDLSLEFGFVTPYTSLFVEVPVIDKISEATTKSGTLAEPEPMPTAAPAYVGPGGGEGAVEAADASTGAQPKPEATATRASGKSEATDEATGVFYAPAAVPKKQKRLQQRRSVRASAHSSRLQDSPLSHIWCGDGVSKARRSILW